MNGDAPTPVPPAPKTPALAIWSLVLGCLAIVLLFGCIGIVLAIPAVICGHLAYSRIKRAGGALSGQGLALAGMITGYVSIGASILLIPLMAGIAIPNFVKARQTAQQNYCINNLRMIEGAKQTWALEKNKTPQDTPTMEELNRYLPKNFASMKCPVGGTYTINRVGEVPACSIASHRLPAAPALER